MMEAEYTCGHNTRFTDNTLAPAHCLVCGQGAIVFTANMWAAFSCGHHVDPLTHDVSREECSRPGCDGHLQGFTDKHPTTMTFPVLGGGTSTVTAFEPGRKYDGEKPAMDLMPPLMELEVAKVLTFGAEKYDAENWRKVPDLHTRYRSAAKRHINALKRGEQFDEESGLHHAAHAVCCLMFMGEIDLEQKDSAA